jgi:hypothetical protein
VFLDPVITADPFVYNGTRRVNSTAIERQREVVLNVR